MSNSVSSFEIEDVLSSIRRLVSVDEREQKQDSKSEDSTQDRLVLSPALRIDGDTPADHDAVVDDIAKAADDDEDGAGEDATDVAEDQSDDVSQPGDDVPNPAEADDNRGDATEDDPQDTAEDHIEVVSDPSADDDEEENEDGVWEVLTFSHSDYRAPESNTKVDAVADRDAATLEDVIAEVEAAVATQDDQWEPDEPTDIDFYPETTEPIAWGDSLEDAAEPEEAPVAEEKVADAGAAAAQSETTASGVVSEADQAQADEVETADKEWFADNALLDEDALRDLIGDIVRQELQGALGERITRNVRKLVRREIHRALMAQTFE